MKVVLVLLLLCWIVPTAFAQELRLSFDAEQKTAHLHHPDGDIVIQLTGQDAAQRQYQILRYQAWIAADNISTVADHRDAGGGKLQALLADRVSFFFHVLRKKIGDAAFFSALNRLDGKAVSWGKLTETFSAAAAEDLSRFFGQWLLRPDLPQIQVKDLRVQHEQGHPVLSFTLVQQEQNPYRLHIPLHIKTRTGLVQELIHSSATETAVAIPLDSMPVEALLDPEQDILRQLHPAEHPPLWVQVMGDAQERTIVLPEDPSHLERYLPFMAFFERRGSRLVQAGDLNNSELSQGTLIFLGDSPHLRELFGPLPPPKQGFTVDVRKNPLKPHQVMALISSSALAETSLAVDQLPQMGAYSFLHFQHGEIQAQSRTAADQGIRLHLPALPSGIPKHQVQDFDQILADIRESQVIYVGENHTDYAAHILQLQVIQALLEQGRSVVVGMEMFPRSVQAALDDLIQGRLAGEEEFLEQSRYYTVWGYDYRLYRDIINYAKRQQIPLLGLNLDRQIVNSVFRQGNTDALSPEQRAEMAAERDLTLPGYQRRLEAIYALHQRLSQGEGFGGFIQAQAIWDEGMAESIVQYLQQHPQKTLVVLAGVGHVCKENGIPPRVKRRLDVRQSVLIPIQERAGDIQADYLLFLDEARLPPEGKIGVLLKETDSIPKQVQITEILPQSRAGEAGLQAEDILRSINGRKVEYIGHLRAGLLDKAPGDKVLLEVGRGEEILELEVELSEVQGGP